MKQIYPDIVDLVHEGKNVSGFVCVFTDEHLHSFLLHFLFFLILTLRNNRTPLTPQFKTWDLNLYRQLFSMRNVKHLTEFPEGMKSHNPLIKTTLQQKSGHIRKPLAEGCLFDQMKKVAQVGCLWHHQGLSVMLKLFKERTENFLLKLSLL